MFLAFRLIGISIGRSGQSKDVAFFRHEKIIVSKQKRSASLLYSSPLYRNGHAKDSLRCRISSRKKVRIQSVEKSCLESMRSS